MGDDLIPILTRFHREIVLPDMQRLMSDAVSDFKLRLNAHFEEINGRFDRLETGCQMIKAGLKRLEERLDRVEQVVRMSSR
jgi:hypothetical protein